MNKSIRVYSEEEEAKILSHCLKHLKYDPSTGRFKYTDFAKANRWNLGESPEMIGRYSKIRILGRKFMSHRIAWLMCYGRFPKLEIDHINNVKTDNRIENLRECDHSQNKANVKMIRTNTSGYKGVSWKKREQRYRAQIEVKGKTISLGYYHDPREAHLAYLKASKEYFGDFALPEVVPKPQSSPY